MEHRVFLFPLFSPGGEGVALSRIWGRPRSARLVGLPHAPQPRPQRQGGLGQAWGPEAAEEIHPERPPVSLAMILFDKGPGMVDI